MEIPSIQADLVIALVLGISIFLGSWRGRLTGDPVSPPPEPSWMSEFFTGFAGSLAAITIVLDVRPDMRDGMIVVGTTVWGKYLISVAMGGAVLLGSRLAQSQRDQRRKWRTVSSVCFLAFWGLGSAVLAVMSPEGRRLVLVVYALMLVATILWFVMRRSRSAGPGWSSGS